MADATIPTVSELRASLSGSAPPPGLTVPLEALWWAEKNDWNRAHSLVQGGGGPQAAWVHAYLHREEGDLSNAAYWYRRADRKPSSAPLEAEWEEIAASFLAAMR